MRLTTAVIVLAFAAGIAAGEFMYRSVVCRDAIGKLCGRGRLLALVKRSGIYELDLKREIEADSYAAGITQSDQNTIREVLMRLIANERVRKASEKESVSEAQLEHTFELLQFEFADKKMWTTRLEHCGLSSDFLRAQLRNNLRAQKWLEHQIATEIKMDDASCRQFYAVHRQDFAQPLRLRASHLFLAAPPETPPEVVSAKRAMIESLAARIAHREEFPALVAEASEDEATKLRGGDLGYFSASRMPNDFFAAVSKLRVGEVSKPIRSELGFHLVRVAEIKPPREMSYEEAEPEISRLLGNQRRQSAVEVLSERMAQSAKYFALMP
jgi:parvulin-like peptidyl-prolyl isomerase